MKKYFFYLLAFFLLTSTGCGGLGGTSLAKPKPLSVGEMTGTGSIVFVDVEGGFYGIKTDQKEKLLPLNLPERFKDIGLPVIYRAKKADAMTIQMWGTPVELLELKTDQPEGPESFIAN